MSEKKEDKYGAFKHHLDQEFEYLRTYLQRMRDNRTELMIKAHKNVDYKIEGNEDKYKKELIDSLERNLSKTYNMKDIKGVDKGIIDELFGKHFGVTKEQIGDIVDTHKEKTRDVLEQQMGSAESDFTQSHYRRMANDYARPENIEHLIKYLDLESMPSFDKTAVTPDQLAQIMLYKGVRGRFSEEDLPTKLRKKTKAKKDSSHH